MSAGIAFEGVLVVVIAFVVGWAVFRSVDRLSSRWAVGLITLALWALGFARLHWIDLELPLSTSHWYLGGETVPATLAWASVALLGAKWGAFYVVILRARRAYDSAA